MLSKWDWYSIQDYKKFWENFGKFLKLGCVEDTGNHKRITPLLRFFSSKSEEELISLDDYVENMPENQNGIYYLATDSLKSAKTAPFVEKLVQKGIEVSIFSPSLTHPLCNHGQYCCSFCLQYLS